jgi:hypothetical protein
LYWAGTIQIDYGNLTKAQKRLERVQELAQSAEQPFYKYASLSLGDIRVKRGDLGGALQSHKAALAIIERLAKSNANNAGLQRDLSVSYERLAACNRRRAICPRR